MSNVKKVLTKAMVSLIAVVMTVSSLGFIVSMLANKDTGNVVMSSEVMTVSSEMNADNGVIPAAGYDDVAEGMVTFDNEMSLEFYLRADDGAFWTRDHLEVELTMSNKIPGLMMEVTYHDGQDVKEEPVERDLAGLFSYTTVIDDLNWNQVKKFTVRFYSTEIGGSSIIELSIRHD